MSGMNRYTPNRRVFLASAGAGLLSGCSSLQLIPAPLASQLYLLRPQMTMPPGPPVNWRLAVATPDAPASLDTERIALTRSALTMDYYANAAWNDRVSTMVQSQLIQVLDASGRIVSVARDTAGLETDYLLQTEIRNFEARYDAAEGPPLVIVSIQAKLARMPQRQIVANLNATQQAQASGTSLDMVVSAFNQAAGAAIAQIAAWALGAPPPNAA